MRILICENGQHVIESCRYMSKMGHEIIFASYLVNSFTKRFFLSKAYNKIVKIEKKKDDYLYIKEIKKIFDQYYCDVFFPFGFNLVTKYMNQINKNNKFKMNTPYGSYKSYWNLTDKSKLYDLLENSPILLPKLFGKIKYDDKLILRKSFFPVILKRTSGKGIKENVRIAWNNNQIKKYLELLSKSQNNKGDFFIIQQYIPGDIFDVGGFSINGKIFYNVPQRRTITKPLRGGVAAVNDIYNDPELLHLTKIIIKKAKWTGPFQTEFRYNPSDKKYYLLEVNAKMWGSTPLSLKANPDLLNIALNFAIGDNVEKSLHFIETLRYRWILQQELISISNGTLPDLISFLKRFLKSSYYDFDINDPLPDIGRLLGSLKTIFFNHKNLEKPLIDKNLHNILNQQNKG